MDDERRIYEILEAARKKQKRYGAFALACFSYHVLYVLWVVLLADKFFLGDDSVFLFQIIITLIGGFACMPIFVLMIYFLIRYAKAYKEYENDYKRLIARPVLESMFDNAQYYPDKGYTQEEFKGMHLIYWRNGFNYCSEDLIRGTHKGLDFSRADIRITHRNDNNIVVDIDGRLMEFPFSKDINSRILIVKNRGRVLVESGLNEVIMEDMDFNQKFTVYAEDAHSVFYLLTPRFMEYVKSLYNKDDAIYISFDRGRLYFLESGHGGIFETPQKKLDEHVDIRREIEKSKAELEEIGEIIEMLQLDKAGEMEKMINA